VKIWKIVPSDRGQQSLRLIYTRVSSSLMSQFFKFSFFKLPVPANGDDMCTARSRVWMPLKRTQNLRRLRRRRRRHHGGHRPIVAAGPAAQTQRNRQPRQVLPALQLRQRFRKVITNQKFYRVRRPFLNAAVPSFSRIWDANMCRHFLAVVNI